MSNLAFAEALPYGRHAEEIKPAGMAIYDAFISYSHARDKPIAAALQSLLETIGKPWYRRRSLTIFRDDACLAATPLWPAIENALSHSRYLLLLASPQAAESAWVAREVDQWLRTKNVDTILIAVTSGRLEWDDTRGDFVWDEFTPLPPNLKGRFTSEPKWVEMHSLRRRSPRLSGRFNDMGATLAAAIHGVTKDTLLAKEVWQQRRALMLASATAAVMMVLGVTTAWYWRDAVQAHDFALAQQHEIVQQTQQAERTLMAAARAANAMIVGMARDLASRTDLPKDFVQNLLYRAQFLQDQIAETAAYAPDLMRSNVLALADIATALLRHGDPDGAIIAAKRAVTLAARLVEMLPQDIDRQRLLAESHERLADTYAATGNAKEARDALVIAAQLREKLAKANPGRQDLQDEYAAAQKRLG
jgi:hypothetical protein